MPEPTSPLPDETCDALVGRWRILQKRRGHRWSTDDLLLGWWALAEAPPRVDRALDLGCGIGSVALIVAWGLKTARVTGVEAQAESLALAGRSVRLNGQEDRFDLRLGDLRDPTVLPEGEAFDLVTGSPPYIPLGRGTPSPVAQRAGARLELRGGIEDYCQAARRSLAPGGRFCVVQSGVARVLAAAGAAGLRVTRLREVLPREGAGPLFALFTMVRDDEPRPAGDPERLADLVVRDASGRRTGPYREARRALGMPE